MALCCYVIFHQADDLTFKEVCDLCFLFLSSLVLRCSRVVPQNPCSVCGAYLSSVHLPCIHQVVNLSLIIYQYSLFNLFYCMKSDIMSQHFGLMEGPINPDFLLLSDCWTHCLDAEIIGLPKNKLLFYKHLHKCDMLTLYATCLDGFLFFASHCCFLVLLLSLLLMILLLSLLLILLSRFVMLAITLCLLWTLHNWKELDNVYVWNCILLRWAGCKTQLWIAALVLCLYVYLK